MTEANAKVAQSLFQMATQGKNVAAAIFWMKARAGWREKIEVRPDANVRTRYDGPSMWSPAIARDGAMT